MAKVGETYKLDSVVFGGTGVNVNTVADDAKAYWVSVDAFLGAKIIANDTVSLVLNPADSTITATLIGRPVAIVVEDGYYLVGTMNNWTPQAANKFAANEGHPGEFVLTATLAVDDEFKIVKIEGGNWTWYPAEGDNFLVMACYAGEKTMYFNPTFQEGWRLLGGHLYMEYTFNPGFYLVGSMTNWLPQAPYWFGEYFEDPPYTLETTLEVGWEIKVAKLEGTGVVYEYYPDGEGTHYTVDAAHAGEVIVYFSQYGNADGSWTPFGGYMYIAPNLGTGVETTAVDGEVMKVLRNGRLLIIKGEKTYNAQGQLVK